MKGRSKSRARFVSSRALLYDAGQGLYRCGRRRFFMDPSNAASASSVRGPGRARDMLNNHARRRRRRRMGPRKGRGVCRQETISLVRSARLMRWRRPECDRVVELAACYYVRILNVGAGRMRGRALPFDGKFLRHTHLEWMWGRANAQVRTAHAAVTCQLD